MYFLFCDIISMEGCYKMKLTEILNLECFQNVEVIGGVNGLSNDVSNVYVMEVPDITSYVKKDGLLLTTLFPIINDKTALKNFIPKLKNMEVAGVGIKIGRYIDHIPEYMIQQARNLSFPILLLPSNADFSFLSNEILTRLIGIKNKKIEFRDNISNKLHKLLLSGADINELTSYISKITDMDILIIDAQIKIIDTSLKNNYNNIEISNSNCNKNISVKINNQIIKKERMLVYPISNGDKNIGYLICLKKNRNKIPNLTIVIEQSVILFSYLLQKRQSLIQKERSYLDNFISSLIFKHHGLNEKEIIHKATIFNWNINFPSLILLIDIESSNNYDQMNNYYNILDLEIIEEIIISIFNVYSSNIKAALFNNQILCFLSISSISNLQPKIQQACEQIVYCLKKYGTVTISGSKYFMSIDDIPASYNDAVLVKNIYNYILPKKSFVKFYNDLGIFKLFHSINNNSILEQFINETIGSVLQYDRENNLNLIDTLQTLINNNMNMKQSSRDLYIHYNTLRYRVDKLNELNIDLSDGRKTTEVAVALEIIKYLKSNK